MVGTPEVPLHRLDGPVLRLGMVALPGLRHGLDREGTGRPAGWRGEGRIGFMTISAIALCHRRGRANGWGDPLCILMAGEGFCGIIAAGLIVSEDEVHGPQQTRYWAPAWSASCGAWRNGGRW